MAITDRRGGVWRARVRLQGFRARSRSFDTRRDAQDWAYREESALLAGMATVPDLSTELSLGEALDRYKREETIHKKGRTMEERRIEKWKRHRLASIKLSLLRPQHFLEYRRERLLVAADNTVRIELSLISSLFKVAKAEWGMPYLDNPISLRGLSTGKRRDRRLNSAEAKRFWIALGRCRNERVAEVVIFALCTAARQGEILKLQRDDVDVRRRSVTFRDTKNGDSRTVPLTRQTLELVRRVLGSHDRDFVFPITRAALVSAWQRLRKEASLEDYRFHDLRHEATSQLFERGLSVMEVQRITGHKTLSMLLRYTHLNVDHAVQRLDATDDSDMMADKAMSPAALHGPGSQSDSTSNVVPFRSPGAN